MKRIHLRVLTVLIAAVLWSSRATPASASVPIHQALTALVNAAEGGSLILYGGWMMLDRDNSDRVILASLRNPVDFSLTGQLDSNQVKFGYESGMFATVGYRFNEVLIAEGTFFGLNQWEETAALSNTATPGILNSAFLTLNGVGVAGYNLNYQSKLNSGEANLRYLIGDDEFLWISFFGGFRYIDFRDQADLNGTLLATNTRELTRSHATNQLYGGHFGVDVNFIANYFAGLSAYGKGGFYSNQVQSRIQNTFTPAGASSRERLNATEEDTVPAASVEGGVMGRVRISDNIEFRGGYHFLFLTGVALAPAQLPANQAVLDRTILTNPNGSFLNERAEINRDGNILFHGPFIGIELHW